MCKYLDPKEPGYECPRTGRVAVPVATFAASELNGDAAAYMFSQDSDDMGLEPWRLVEGVDGHLNGEKYDVWFTDGGFITVSPGSTVFVSAEDARRLAAGPG